MVKIADRILFYLVLKPLSYFPLGVLYVYSDISYFILYNFVRYRRKVVRKNLCNAFPEKSKAEIKKIEKGFYRHFTDFIFESIKAVSISDKQLEKRTTIKNPELIERLYQENKNVIVTCGHFNNWEFYALQLPELVKHTTFSVYQPLKNTFYDKILYKSRTRKGMRLIKTRDVIPFFKEEHIDKRMIVMVNDQSPSCPEKAHWNTFMNQETGWNVGPEKLATKYGYCVLFGFSKRVRRGYYEVEFKHITCEPAQMAEGEITDTYAKILEELIREKPQYWLWSHKRWKHKRKAQQQAVETYSKKNELHSAS